MKAKDRKVIERAARMHEAMCQALWDEAVRQLAAETGMEAEEVEELFAQLT